MTSIIIKKIDEKIDNEYHEIDTKALNKLEIQVCAIERIAREVGIDEMEIDSAIERFYDLLVNPALVEFVEYR